MRILLVTNIFPNPCQPTKGPFNLQMVRELAKAHDVQVIVPVSWLDEWQAKRRGAGGMSPDRAASVEGATVHYPRYYYTPRMFRRYYGAFLWHSVRRRVDRLLDGFRPDVVLGYWIHPDGDVAVRIARRLGVPAVIMSGGSDALLLTRGGGRRRRIIDVLGRAEAIVAVSYDLKDRIAALGVPAERIHVVHRGVDASRFAPGDRSAARHRLGVPADERALLWVGRMVPVKGLEVLIEALAVLRQRGAPCRAYLVGDGPLRPMLETLAGARGISDMVRFVGMVPHAALPDWYVAADLTILPSRSEGLPNVLRESRACGTPFVASRVGGIPEIAGPQDRLVPPGDAALLADAVAQAVAVRESAPIAREVHENPRPLSWAESASALVDILEPLTRRSPVGAGVARYSVVPA